MDSNKLELLIVSKVCEHITPNGADVFMYVCLLTLNSFLDEFHDLKSFPARKTILLFVYVLISIADSSVVVSRMHQLEARMYRHCSS
jgi:hypothetical protein